MSAIKATYQKTLFVQDLTFILNTSTILFTSFSMTYALYRIDKNSKNVHQHLAEDYEDEDESFVEGVDSEPFTDATNTLNASHKPDEESKFTVVPERRVEESSFYFSIRKHEDLMRKKLQQKEMQNEIEEIGIRDLFIRDSVTLSVE